MLGHILNFIRSDSKTEDTNLKGTDQQDNISEYEEFNIQNDLDFQDRLKPLSSGRLTDDQLEQIYQWVDEVPLGKKKKNITRDSSDCQLVAQVIKHHLPQKYKHLVEVHNYIETGKQDVKYQNWEMLNRKVLTKFYGFKLSKKEIKGAVECHQGATELALYKIKMAMEYFVRNPNLKGKKIEKEQSSSLPIQINLIKVQ